MERMGEMGRQGSMWSHPIRILSRIYIEEIGQWGCKVSGDKKLALAKEMGKTGRILSGTRGSGQWVIHD